MFRIWQTTVSILMNFCVYIRFLLCIPFRFHILNSYFIDRQNDDITHLLIQMFPNNRKKIKIKKTISALSHKIFRFTLIFKFLLFPIIVFFYFLFHFPRYQTGWFKKKTHNLNHINIYLFFIEWKNKYKKINFNFHFNSSNYPFNAINSSLRCISFKILKNTQ